MRNPGLRDSPPLCICPATTRNTRSVSPPRVGNCVWTTTTPTLHLLCTAFLFLTFQKKRCEPSISPSVLARTACGIAPVFPVAPTIFHMDSCRAHLCTRYLSVLRMSPCLCPVCACVPRDTAHVFDTPMLEHMCPHPRCVPPSPRVRVANGSNRCHAHIAPL